MASAHLTAPTRRWLIRVAFFQCGVVGFQIAFALDAAADGRAWIVLMNCAFAAINVAFARMNLRNAELERDY